MSICTNDVVHGSGPGDRGVQREEKLNMLETKVRGLVGMTRLN